MTVKLTHYRLAKTFGSGGIGWFTGDGLTDRVNQFFDRHQVCGRDGDENHRPFELSYESEPSPVLYDEGDWLRP